MMWWWLSAMVSCNPALDLALDRWDCSAAFTSTEPDCAWRFGADNRDSRLRASLGERCPGPPSAETVRGRLAYRAARAALEACEVEQILFDAEYPGCHATPCQFVSCVRKRPVFIAMPH